MRIAITGALGGQTDLTASNALAPYAAQMIGEKFGHGEDKNTTAQMVSHAIFGATLAYVNGGNPAAGVSAAVASEAAANYLAKQYDDGKTAIDPVTGLFEPNLLPEDVKTQIRDLTAAIGAVAGGTVGDSAFNAQLAGVVGQNAVENNVDSYKDIQDAQANSQKMYKDACAAYGLGEPACGNRIKKEWLEILQGTAMIFVPTSVYEIIPIGKGVGIVVKGTKKIVAVYKDAKSAEKAAEKAGAKLEASRKVNETSEFKEFSEKATQITNKSSNLKSIDVKQLDKKFKHAEDFGISTTKKNPQTLKQFESAIKARMNDQNTISKGTYGFVKDSKVFFNSQSNNIIVVDKAGNFVTGLKITPGTPQYVNYIQNGVLR